MHKLVVDKYAEVVSSEEAWSSVSDAKVIPAIDAEFAATAAAQVLEGDILDSDIEFAAIVGEVEEKHVVLEANTEDVSLDTSNGENARERIFSSSVGGETDSTGAVISKRFESEPSRDHVLSLEWKGLHHREKTTAIFTAENEEGMWRRGKGSVILAKHDSE